MFKKGFFYLTTSILIGGVLYATDVNRDINTTMVESNLKKVVISINDTNYTNADFPTEFNRLKSYDKNSFLVTYSNYMVTLDSLKTQHKSLQKEIDILIKKRDTNNKRLGIEVNPLKRLIANLKLTLDTIAYKEVEKQHPEIDKEVKDFFQKHKNDYNYPNYVEISSIKVKDENLSKEIIKKINKESNSTKLALFMDEAKRYKSRNIRDFTYMGAIIADNKKYGKDFFNQIWLGNEGEILTKPIKKDNIYYIIFIHKKSKSGSSSFDSIKEDIKGYILKKERVLWIKNRYKDIKKDSKVIIYNNNL